MWAEKKSAVTNYKDNTLERVLSLIIFICTSFSVSYIFLVISNFDRGCPFFKYTKERGNIMKNIIKKSITVITIIAMAFTLAMPMTVEAATKKAPKLNKSKVTLTITKKKTKPTVQLKVKNTAGKKVKWTTSNKKVATVSKNGKVTAKKKGTAVVRAKVNKRTLTCKIIVKDKRKSVSNKPNSNAPTTCQHNWAYHYGSKQIYVCIICNGCNEHFTDMKEFKNHDAEMITQNDINHGGWRGCDEHGFVSDNYKYCTKCGIKETIN